MRSLIEADVAEPAHTSSAPLDPTHTALGTWSGGNYLPFGVPLDPERLAALFRPGPDLRTVLTSDVYGCGAADCMLGGALAGVPRDSVCVIGSVGHDFYTGHREWLGGFQRFTDPRLRGPEGYADFLRMATERALERVGIDRFDVLMLHNPDRRGYWSEAVWEGMAALRDAGLTRSLGVAPGPDNGFILDMIGCFERFGALIDWAMLILNPFEPWPASLALPAAEAHGIRVMTRVLDHGGVFWDDVRPGHRFYGRDHRTFRPTGWIEAANAKLDRLRPIAERHGLSLLQLAGAWNLAQPAVACVLPTISQELGDGARSVEDKRAELALVPEQPVLSPEEIEEMRTLGMNTGTVILKGASRQYQGTERADQWQMTDRHEQIAVRWHILPDRDMYVPDDPRDMRERGAPRDNGEVQALDRRLFVALQPFSGRGAPADLLLGLESAGLEGVVYASANDPRESAVVLLDEDPARLLDGMRTLAALAGDGGLEPTQALAMAGRTYGTGREGDLADWLLAAPRRKLADPENEWGVWYPLRRAASFYRLPERRRVRMLAEHGRVGASFAQAGYAADIRLECFGLDPCDNEFVLGLLGARPEPLSRLVQAMRSTEHTADYIERLGPFYVGHRVGHTLRAAA